MIGEDIIKRAPELIARLKLSKNCDQCIYKKLCITEYCVDCNLDQITAELIEFLLSELEKSKKVISERDREISYLQSCYDSEREANIANWDL